MKYILTAVVSVALSLPVISTNARTMPDRVSVTIPSSAPNQTAKVRQRIDQKGVVVTGENKPANKLID